MTIQGKVIEDWKNALKAKDVRKDALSMIITELKNRAIKDNVTGGEGRVVADEVALEVLAKMAKQRKEAIDAYREAKRSDLADKEQSELLVIEHYLPKALSDDELRDLVAQAIAKTNASSLKEMGQVMGACIKAAQGRADGKRIQAMVQALLSNRT